MISRREMLDIIATEALEAGSPAPTGSAGSPWTARDVVAKLVEATDLLLDHCDYDGHGWEEIHTARAIAREWLSANGPHLICDQATGDILIQLPNATTSATPNPEDSHGS